ncbi:hypothetical protein ACWKWC_24605 [Geodermatophilus nigrescens]
MLHEVLHSPEPDGEDALALFGRLTGSWRLSWRGLGLDGDWATAEGDLHVGRVLGGRAVQDVWVVPGPGRPGAGVPPRAFHGTTVRFPDPHAPGTWRSTWMDPVNGRVRRFTGRPTGDGGVLLLSDDEEPWLRWRFSDVRPRSFTWSAETSPDRGVTWVHDELMTAERVD